ncbi:Calx-beta domain-containing protein [Aphanothece sacrum]|uniref:Sodium:calcium exchanger n=1 Tax=Aphanothece sacrum FPU1 TaxID=1920663 RepID=A0A401IIM6_APHSA|nr:Calx-beta domain-containing protein [Aphanothece sacrum]GBF80961.1 sodium:calcium exchanger [Aphanothece sacrum FPU1]GBF85268.1 sodium:calcium exchanger [Aphanothece sacrum FPU3]
MDIKLILDALHSIINPSDATDYVSLIKKTSDFIIEHSKELGLSVNSINPVNSPITFNHSDVNQSLEKFSNLEERLNKIFDNINLPKQSQTLLREQITKKILDKIAGLDQGKLGHELTNNNQILGEINDQLNSNLGSFISHFTTNNLLERQIGWVGNNSDDKFSTPNLSCSCPNCTNPILLNNTTSQNIVSGKTTSLSPEGTTTNLPINALLSGNKWTFPSTNTTATSTSSPTLTYSFYEDTIFAGSYYGVETGVREVSEGVKTNVRSILNWVQNTININFLEVQETNKSTYGQMRFMISDNPNYAYAYYPSTGTMGGEVHLKGSYDNTSTTNGFQNPGGKHGFMSLIHEIGHALGLRHSFDGGLDPSLDNSNNTVMGYNFKYGDVSAASTFAPLDIAALQSLYGARVTTTNDTYLFKTIDKFTVNGQSGLNTNSPNVVKQTIWDGDGNDTIDLSLVAANTAGYRVDLNPGGFITQNNVYQAKTYTINGIAYQTTASGTQIAYDTFIENLINSKSSDNIYLNAIANKVSGYNSTIETGNDIIYNGTSQDIVQLDYKFSAVTRTQTVNDLVLGLGTKGSITLKDYYLNLTNQINVNYLDSLGISISDAQVIEGNSGITKLLFTVNLSGAATEAFTLNYNTVDGTAKGGIDYASITNGSLNFLVGETHKTIEVQVNGDLVYDGNENLTLQLLKNSNIPGYIYLLDSQGLGTIIDDDVPSKLSITDVTVNENGTATLAVNLSGAAGTTVSVDYSTANGTALSDSDYTAQTGTLTFNAGVTQQFITISLINDTVYEPTAEKFFVNLTNAKNATISNNQGVVTIIDNDSKPTISINDVTKLEGNVSGSINKTTFQFTVSLSNASSQSISVNYATANGTAIAGSTSDYLSNSGILTFSPLQTSKTISVTVNRDSISEVNEQFFVNLTNPTNATIADGQGIGTITNDDVITGATKTANRRKILPSATVLASTDKVDILTGTNKKDLFTLGDSKSVYYAQRGFDDLAVIKDFQEGDTIQLHGDASMYKLMSSFDANIYGIGDFKGTGIFNNNQDNQELIGIVSDVNSMSLESKAFSFV